MGTAPGPGSPQAPPMGTVLSAHPLALDLQAPALPRLLPAREALDVSSEEEGPAPQRHLVTLGHPSAANSSYAKATPFWNHLLPGPRSLCWTQQTAVLQGSD